MKPLLNPQQISRADIGRTQWILAIAITLTIIVTFTSVKELATAVADNQVEQDGTAQITERDWRNIMQRAVEHMEENLPHIPHGVHVQNQQDLNSAHIPDKFKMGGNEVKGSSSGKTLIYPEDFNPKIDGKKIVKAADLLTEQCNMLHHYDYWGDPLIWGTGNKKNSAEECCAECFNYRPPTKDDPECNVWVFCEDKDLCGEQYQDCWVKHLVHPFASKPKFGPEIGWVSGVYENAKVDNSSQTWKNDKALQNRKYHTVTTAQGQSVHWQMRVHYYWFLKCKKQCIEKFGDECDMGGFTRLLHSGKADDLMKEIPTKVVDTLPPELETKGYVVLNRPNAFVQWVQTALKEIPERYILMSEPDHLFLGPLQNPMEGDRPAAFPFFYIEPHKKEFKHITEKFTGPLTRQQIESIAPIGNSPTFMALKDLGKVVNDWKDISLKIFTDTEANKEWGWVQEMYAFTIACFNNGIGTIDLHLNLMAQPPFDDSYNNFDGKPYNILHFTYGMDYDLDGKFTPGKYGDWRFDKRSYASKPPPRHLGDPPKDMKNDLVRHLIKSINEVTDRIPNWDEYVATGKVTPWDGKFDVESGGVERTD